MEFLKSVLDGIGWFFSLQPVNVALGGFFAAGFGLWAFFIQTSHREKREKRRIARALLQEMLHAFNFLQDSYMALKELHDQGRNSTVSDLLNMVPSERKIFAMLGGEVGALSDIAAADAVDFDSSLQALERDFQAVAGPFHGHSQVGADVAGDLADKVSATLDNLSVNLNSIIKDAYGGETIPESTRKMIQGIQSS